MRFVVSLLLLSSVWIERCGVAEAAASNSTLLSNNDLGTSSPHSSVIGIILSLIVVIILVILTIKFLGRKTQVKQMGSIQVLAARQLAPNRFVEVIEVAGKRYLVGVGEEVTLLADVTENFPDSEPINGEAGAFSTVFTSALEAVRSKYGREKHEGDKQ